MVFSKKLNSLFQISNIIKNVIGEHSVEFVFDGNKQNNFIKTVEIQIFSYILAELEGSKVNLLKIAKDFSNSGFNLKIIF